MGQMFRNWLQAPFHWPLIVGFLVLVAAGVVLASPVSSQRIISSAATVSDHPPRAALRSTEPIDSADGNYVSGLVKAVPGLVHQ